MWNTLFHRWSRHLVKLFLFDEIIKLNEEKINKELEKTNYSDDS